MIVINCPFLFVCLSTHQLILLSAHLISPSNDPFILSSIYPSIFFLANIYWVLILCRIIVWCFLEWGELNTAHKMLSMTCNNSYNNFKLSMRLLGELYYWWIRLLCLPWDFSCFCFLPPKFRGDAKDSFLNLIRGVGSFSLEKRPSVGTQSKCYNLTSSQWTNEVESDCTFQKSWEEKKAKNWEFRKREERKANMKAWKQSNALLIFL